MRFKPVHQAPMLRASALAIAVSFCATAAQAQTVEDGGTTLSIDADLRVLAEAIDGQFRPGSANGEFLLTSRLQVSAEADFGPIAIGGELRDSRALSIESDSVAGSSSMNALEPLQAWIAVDFAPMGGEARLKAGRFTQSIGSGRLIGTPGYANNIVSYAGAQLNWKTGGTNVTGFWAHPFDTRPSSAAELRDNKVALDSVSDGVTIFGAHVARAGLFSATSGEIYVYRLAEHDTPDSATKNRHLTTIGARLYRKPTTGRVDFDIEGAGQFGTIRSSSAASNTTDIDVGAAFAHIEAGWSFAGSMKPRIALEFDYATGDGRDAGQFGRFDMLYGARRTPFGPTGIYGPLSWNNIVSPGVRFSFQPAADLDFFAAVRGAWLDSETDSFAKTGVRDASGNAGTYAGTQVEARARYWLIKKRLRLELGGAVFANGRFLEDAPNASGNGDTHYGYAALSASF
ncbi:MAG: alginate export family protein [Sphingomonas sp.]|nr:alginate export family protein [Sphingomonas sp.]